MLQIITRRFCSRHWRADRPETASAPGPAESGTVSTRATPARGAAAFGVCAGLALALVALVATAGPATTPAHSVFAQTHETGRLSGVSEASGAVGMAADAPAGTGAQGSGDPSSPDAECDVRVDKTARPRELAIGGSVTVELSIEAECADAGGAGAVDVVLLIDRSASMGDGGYFEPAIAAAEGFLDAIDFGSGQVAIASFYMPALSIRSRVSVDRPLSSDGDAVRAALRGLAPPPAITGGTDLASAVEGAQSELESERGRAEATPVIVLLTDGDHNALLAADPIEVADAAKAAGTTIATIGIGVDGAGRRTLERMASRPGLFYEAPTAAELADVYRAVAGAIATPGRLRDLVVTDLLTLDVELVEGSAEPPAAVTAGALTWRIDSVGASGWSASYRVRPLRTGRYATNKLAYVDFLEPDGSDGSRVFPIPEIDVREPSAVGLAHMPVAYSGYCYGGRPFDVVLAIDASTSMRGEKLAAALGAARGFIDLLALPPSRAAVVAFNRGVELVTPLTSDAGELRASLSDLATAEGTRIDLALTLGIGELTGRRADPDHAKALVLLTDGRHAGSPASEALDAGAAARRAGVTVYSIAVGDDIDEALLIQVAGMPDRYYHAADSEALVAIYKAIAGALPCALP